MNSKCKNSIVVRTSTVQTKQSIHVAKPIVVQGMQTIDYMKKIGEWMTNMKSFVPACQSLVKFTCFLMCHDVFLYGGKLDMSP